VEGEWKESGTRVEQEYSNSSSRIICYNARWLAEHRLNGLSLLGQVRVGVVKIVIIKKHQRNLGNYKPVSL